MKFLKSAALASVLLASCATTYPAVADPLVSGIVQPTLSVAISISTATTTLLITALPGRSTYISNWNVVAAGTGNFQLEYGDNSSCSNPVALTGNYNLVAQAGIVVGDGLGYVLVAPAGKYVCALTSAAVGMAGSITGNQF